MYYGIDSGTSAFPTGARTKDFYIGRIGRDTTANLDFYNTTGANLATNKYGYWFLYGPTKDPNYSSNYTSIDAINWGASQATQAMIQWNNIHTSYGLNKTIFADVEWDYSTSNPSGARYNWLLNSENSNAHILNFSVFQGFINYVNLATQYYYSGCYCSKGPWQAIMGTTNSPGYANTFWAAGSYTSSFDTPPTSMSGAPTINGATPTIWQYYGGTKDADIASNLPG